MRVNRGNTVTWRDSDGNLMSGVALEFRPGHLIAGVQNAEKPYTSVRVFNRKLGKAVAIRVPNNSLWAVPFESVVSTGVTGVSRETVESLECSAEAGG